MEIPRATRPGVHTARAAAVLRRVAPRPGIVRRPVAGAVVGVVATLLAAAATFYVSGTGVPRLSEGAPLRDWIVLVPGAAVAIVFGALILWAARREQRRVVQAATARGFQVVPAASLWQAGFCALPFIAGRPDGRFSHAFHRRVGEVDVWAFTFDWGDDSSDPRRVVVFDFGASVLPAHFELRPEWLLEHVFGGDIDFAEDPEFSRHWRLTGSDERAIRTLFRPEARRLFVRERGKWYVQGGGRWLLVHDAQGTREGSGRGPAAAFDELVDGGARIATALTGR